MLFFDKIPKIRRIPCLQIVTVKFNTQPPCRQKNRATAPPQPENNLKFVLILQKYEGYQNIHLDYELIFPLRRPIYPKNIVKRAKFSSITNQSFFIVRTNRLAVFQIERHPNNNSELGHQW